MLEEELSYLEPDELVIECQLRGIDPGHESARDRLRSQLRRELTEPWIRPSLSHPIASAHTELLACGSKICELGETRVSPALAVSPTLSKTVLARCSHLQNRLLRLANTLPTSAPIVKELLEHLHQIRHQCMEDSGLGTTAGTTSSTQGADQQSSASAPGWANISAAFNQILLGQSQRATPQASSTRPPVESRPPPNANRNSRWQASRYLQPGVRTGNPLPPDLNPNDTPGVDTGEIDVSPGLVRTIRSRSPKWNLSFSGESSSMSVDDFIFRLESCASDDRINLQLLPSKIHRYLQGKALNWYWTYRRKFASPDWEVMKTALRQTFRGHENDFEMKRMIEDRKQRFNESFGDFRLAVESLAARLSIPLAEYELVQILRHNMSARLQNALLWKEAPNCDVLHALCSQVERLWAAQDRRRPPADRSQRAVNELSEGTVPTSLDLPPGLANSFPGDPLVFPFCGPTESCPDVREEVQAMGQTDAPRTRNVFIGRPINPGLRVCWNCEDLGHSFQNCPKEQRRLFCYGCGRTNRVKANCENCNSTPKDQLNSKTSAPREGVSHSTLPHPPQRM